MVFGYSLDFLMDTFLVPVVILVSSLVIGIFINRMINKYLLVHIVVDSWQHIFINVVRGLPVAWCMGVGLYWSIDTIHLPPTITKMLSYVLFAVIVLTVTRVIARTISGTINFYTARSGENMPKTTLLNNIINIIVYTIGVLIVLQYFGISVAPILTALGVGGMAVALALQDTLANIFAGIHLILSKQIRINDYIRLSSGEEGIVRDITWRFTVIHSMDNNIVIVPNKNISQSNVNNYNMATESIIVGIEVGVDYNCDLEFVEKTCLEVTNKLIATQDPTAQGEPVVRYRDFADSSINLKIFFPVSDFRIQSRMRHELMKAIAKEFRKQNINIPFPIRTIIYDKDE